MPQLKLKAAPLSDSGEDSDDDNELVQKRIKLIREFDKPQQRFTGGIVVSSESDANVHSASASLSAAEKKGLKEVEELERELDLKNTFSKETNRRDEDAEMNKFIDEQIRLRRETAKMERQKKGQDNHINVNKINDSEFSEMFTLPAAAAERVDDILLHTLSKDFSSQADEKSEAMLSSQMLNGIPEVDLGMSERIRTIEATEEAKLCLLSSGSNKRLSKKPSTVPINYSTNYQLHRSSRDRNEGELKTTRRDNRSSHTNNEAKTVTEAVVSIGEQPKEIEYRLPSSGGQRPPPRGKASDDYCLQKFKKNSRR